jgi:hypothetical protein
MAQYFYLIASLPSLKRDEAAPLSEEAFLALCADWVEDARRDFLNKLALRPVEGLAIPADSAIADYLSWEGAVRQRIAKLRAVKLNRQDFTAADADKNFVDAEHVAQECYAAPNPLERERVLDAARWRKIEDLEASKLYFEFDRLCLYKLKLLLRIKWQERQLARGQVNLDKAVDGVQAKRLAAAKA